MEFAADAEAGFQAAVDVGDHVAYFGVGAEILAGDVEALGREHLVDLRKHARDVAVDVLLRELFSM